MKKLTRYKPIKYLITILLTILVCVLVNNAMDNSLLKKLNNEKLKSEALLAEKLLLEKNLNKSYDTISSLILVRHNSGKQLLKQRSILAVQNKNTIKLSDRLKIIKSKYLQEQQANKKLKEMLAIKNDTLTSICRYTKILSDSIVKLKKEIGNNHDMLTNYTASERSGSGN